MATSMPYKISEQIPSNEEIYAYFDTKANKSHRRLELVFWNFTSIFFDAIYIDFIYRIVGFSNFQPITLEF